MLHIKSTHEIISINISEKALIEAVVGKNGFYDNFKGDLLIKTPGRCYIFKDIDYPINFAQILGDRIIEELKKEEITVDMNNLVKNYEVEYLEFNPLSIEGDYEIEYLEFNLASIEIQNTSEVDPNAFVEGYYESINIADILAEPLKFTLHEIYREK